MTMNLPDKPAALSATFSVGQNVYLRGCRVGMPGRVLKVSRDKATVLWVDLDYLAHHACNSLIAAEVSAKEAL